MIRIVYIVLIINIQQLNFLYAQQSPLAEYVRVAHKDVPVVESNRQKVVGIDIDKLMEKYIDQFEIFETSGKGASFSGIRCSWRVKPDPKDPETRYFWGKKRSEQHYRQYINLHVGVFSSHKDALHAAELYFSDISVVPELNPIFKYDPGFVSWTIPLSTGSLFVRDNVFLSLQLSDNFDLEKIMGQIGQELINGSDAVLKGEEINKPQIESDTIPETVVFDPGVQVNSFSLSAHDIDGLNLYRCIWASPIQYETVHPNIVINPVNYPMFQWELEKQVVITSRGSVDETFEVTAVVVNELCVVSDVVVKDIRVKIP